MITLENALWDPALRATPEFEWKNWHQYLDKPGALRGLLAKFALVRTIFLNSAHVIRRERT
jgi:hypothetical protein